MLTAARDVCNDVNVRHARKQKSDASQLHKPVQTDKVFQRGKSEVDPEIKLRAIPFSLLMSSRLCSTSY